MSATPKKQAKPCPKQVAPIALPTWQQTMATALAFVQNSMEQLALIRCDDQNWDEVDVDVDFAVELALGHIKRMRADPPTVRSRFDDEWFKAAAAINLSVGAFSRQDSFYFRRLASVKKQFDVLVEAVEFAQEEECYAE